MDVMGSNELVRFGGDQQEMPNCWKCEHFAISWDLNRPYSCRVMGFKSKALPSIEVMRADGQECRCYLPKLPEIHPLKDAQKLDPLPSGRSRPFIPKPLSGWWG